MHMYDHYSRDHKACIYIEIDWTNHDSTINSTNRVHFWLKMQKRQDNCCQVGLLSASLLSNPVCVMYAHTGRDAGQKTGLCCYAPQYAVSPSPPPSFSCVPLFSLSSMQVLCFEPSAPVGEVMSQTPLGCRGSCSFSHRCSRHYQAHSCGTEPYGVSRSVTALSSPLARWAVFPEQPPSLINLASEQ